MSLGSPIKTIIDLVSVSVRTAPKSGGVDDIFFKDATSLRHKIASQIVAIGRNIALKKTNKELARAIILDWSSDADVVRKSDGLIIIGVDGKHPFGANCGGCGFKSCAEFKNKRDKLKGVSLPGPYCVFKMMDLGIALGSAAKTLAILSVDNRIIYKIGIAAGILKISNLRPLIGIPLSVTGKNIYFDRMEKLKAREIFNKKQK